MKSLRRHAWRGALALTVLLVGNAGWSATRAQTGESGRAQEPAPAFAESTGSDARNTFCPVLTDQVADPAIFATHQGKVVYFCCDNCRRKFLANPDAYLANLPQFGGTEPAAAGADGVPGAGGGAAAGSAEAAKAPPVAPPAGILAKLGWFHPAAVHFPIGLLVAAALAELLARAAGWQAASRAVPYLLFLAAPGAVLAVLLGFATATTAVYSAQMATIFRLHRAAGIGTAALAILAAATLRWRDDPRSARRAAWLGFLLLGALLVTIGGHLGAVLVRGQGPLRLFAGGS